MTDRNFLINDVFWTFQGEGFHAGRRALFLRLPKCNLKCSWCDTEFETFKKWPESDLTHQIFSEVSRFAVITGGEPLMNKQTPLLIDFLKGHHFEIAVETNGTFPFVEGIDFVTCSPKRDADFKVHEGLWKHVDEFKYVVDDKFDFSILERHNAETVLEGGKKVDETVSARLSLSPEFGDFKGNLEKIFGYVKYHPWWRISLQTHKWMEVP